MCKFAGRERSVVIKMKNRKKNLVQFLVWMRNGTAFCVTWILILVLLFCRFSDRQMLSTDWLTKMVLFVAGGVFLFCLAFTKFVIKKWNFVARLTCFMLSIGLYEGVGFYVLGFWKNRGSGKQWFVFIGILLMMYFICITIYESYSKKQGDIYTQALQKYQQQRSAVHEE